jgi:hypothetical protein
MCVITRLYFRMFIHCCYYSLHATGPSADAYSRSAWIYIRKCTLSDRLRADAVYHTQRSYSAKPGRRDGGGLTASDSPWSQLSSRGMSCSTRSDLS